MPLGWDGLKVLTAVQWIQVKVQPFPMNAISILWCSSHPVQYISAHVQNSGSSYWRYLTCSSMCSFSSAGHHSPLHHTVLDIWGIGSLIYHQVCRDDVVIFMIMNGNHSVHYQIPWNTVHTAVDNTTNPVEPGLNDIVSKYLYEKVFHLVLAQSCCLGCRVCDYWADFTVG